MLYFIAVWTLLLIVCCVIGTALLHGFQAQCFRRAGDRLIAAEWMGLIVLAVSLLAASIVMPLTPIVGIAVALVLSAIALFSRAVRSELTERVQQIGWTGWLGYAVLVVIVAAITDQPVIWLDSGLYHYGAIQWLAQYGTVTGIALLFSNLGFVSAWFALTAPFNPPVLDARVSAVTNGFVLVLILLQLGVYLIHWVRGKGQASDGFGLVFFGLMLFAVLFYPLLLEIAISPSPDLPTTFLIGVVSWSMLVITNALPPSAHSPASSPQSPRESQRMKPLARPQDQAVPLLLSAGAMSIKLTAISLVLISSVFYLAYSWRSIRQLCIGGAIGLAILAPMLIAGIKASGCPLYPAAALCLDVPWAQSEITIEAVAQGTHGWTSWYGEPPSGQHPFFWAVSKWLQSERTNKGTVAIIGITLVALVGSLKPLLNSQIRGKFWLIAIEVVGVSFLLMTAPFFRFVLPYLLLIPSLLLVVWGAQLLPPVYHGWLTRLHRSPLARPLDRLWLVAGLCCLMASLTIFVHTHPAFHLLLPPPMQKVPVVQKQVNDLTYFSPQVEGELCWATPLPCGFEVEQVRLRDPDRGVAGGFVRED